MFFDEETDLQVALLLDRLNLIRYSSPCSSVKSVSLPDQDSYDSVRKEFFYEIFQWDSSWAFDDLYREFPPSVIDNIPMNPLKLVYSSYQEYQKIFLSPILSEFWYTLRDDIAEDAKKKKKPITITAKIRELSYEYISVSNKSNDSTRKLTQFKAVATVPRKINKFNKKLYEKYPSRGDFVIIKYSTNLTEDFGYIEEVSRDGNQWSDFTILTYVITTKFCSQTELSGSIDLVTVDWILSYLTNVDSLENISKSPLIKTILKPDVDSFRIMPRLDTLPIVTKDTLNSKQLEIMSRVVTTVETRTPGICLIQGPPGTGKSTVIKNIIASVLSRPRTQRVLVCAPSNKAIDELVRRLLAIQPLMKDQGIPWDIVRVGREDKIHKSVKCVSLLNLRKSQFSSLTREQIAEEHILTQANIIACTLTSCYTSYRMKAVFGTKDEKIPFCIIDEASQATEILTLVPLMFSINRLILVGDPQQLPPTILSQKAKEYGYDLSLFARAQKIFESESENPIMMLDTQYRMVNAIAEWPNRYFYRGAIKNAASVAPLNFCNYKVLNHSYIQDSEGHSNPDEATLVAEIVKALIEKSKLTTTDKEISIGVITPYKRQCMLINDLLNPSEVKKLLKKDEDGEKSDKENEDGDKENTDTDEKVSNADDDNKEKKDEIQEETKDKPKQKKIEVNTVDSFQGSECDVIVMSCVRSEGIGFVKDPHRLCVSVTRAKHSLILCGNFNTFRINETWENLLNDAQSRGVYFDISKDEIQAITRHIVVNRNNSFFF
ncbi:putative helicase senataxin [Cotesia typhae]|uniref:putative helicase senataxin n=1 Tax=Cotesia typhae TaxID=2053667 RepID=UPI003D68C475